MSGFTNAVILLRIPFSVFLMPVFWFALLNVAINTDTALDALWVFAIVHLLVYPASNGFNSYFDKDEGSIGGLEKPPAVSKNLLWLIYLFDFLSVALSAFVDIKFGIAIVGYMLVSKAYSWPPIRLKKYPLLSTLSVVVFQGAFMYFAVQLGISHQLDFSLDNCLLALVASLFLAGSYPITQIYQHREDQQRGDQTLSLKLGLKGTFIFSGFAFALASILLALTLYHSHKLALLGVFALFMLPVLFYFNQWFRRVANDASAANFSSTMTMNKLSSVCTSLAFVVMKVMGLFLY
ncbi:prenyltransferase [bacterium]|nr:prenyltransferase [bacterium]